MANDKRGTMGRPGTDLAVVRAGQVEALNATMTKAAPRLAEIVPRHVDPMRVIQLAVSAARRDEKLLACTASSMLIATAQIAALGLEPSTALQQAYLVPRKNRKKVGGAWQDVQEATAIIGYRGFTLLAYDSEGIDVQAEIVRMGDTFEQAGGLSPILKHAKCEDENPGDVRGAYAVWELPNGRRRHLWWTARELRAHRDRFAPKDYETKAVKGPWADHFEAMCLKTMVRMAAKLWPLSSERMRSALRVDDAGEVGRSEFYIPGVGAKADAVKALSAAVGEPPDFYDGPSEDDAPGDPMSETAREPGAEG